MSSHPTRALVAGAGLMGRWHAHALGHMGARVAAVVDPDGPRALDLARRCGGAPVFADLVDVPAELQVDAVHVCTPSSSHDLVIEQALERGWHVLVEKPFAASAPAAERLLQVAAAKRLMACPVHQFVLQRGFERIRSSRSALGPIRHLDAVVCSAGGEGKDEETRRRIAIEIVPHALSMFARLVPEPLSEVEWHVALPDGDEIRAVGLAGHVSLSVLVSLSGRPTRNTLRVIAEGGTAHADLFHGFAVLERGRVSRRTKMSRPFVLAARTFVTATSNLGRRALSRQPAYPGLRELVGRFHHAIRVGSAGPIAPEETLEVARAWDLIRASVDAPRSA